MLIFSNTALKNREQRLTQHLQSMMKPNEVLLIFCGDPIQKPGGWDQNYYFIPHPLYFWISGARRPSGVMAFSTDSGWTHYQTPFSESEKIWEGIHEELIGADRAQLDTHIKKFEKVHVMGQPSAIDFKFSKNVSAESTQSLNVQIELERRLKDDEEVALIEKAAHIATFGYKKFSNRPA